MRPRSHSVTVEHALPTVRQIFDRDAHPVLQFVKYGLCGVAASLVHTGIVLLLSLTLLPAAKGMSVGGASLDEAVRTQNLVLNNLIAFPFGVMVAYFTNVAWVFVPGRRSKTTEVLLFLAVCAAGFFPGLLMVDWLAGRLQLPSSVAQFGLITTAFTVNFFCRKLLIFQR